MDMEPGTLAEPLNTEQLLRLHNLTREVAEFCQAQLRSYLETLAPLFRPRRVLGDYVEGSGREHVLDADRNLTDLRESYFRACGQFDLRKELNTPLESITTQIQLYEWEYVRDVPSGGERKPIAVISPLTWVIAYPSTYTLSMLRQAIAGRLKRDQEGVRQFVLHACLMNLLFSRQPGLKTLFEALRYHTEVRTSPQLGELPLVTISAPLPTTRPPDDLLLIATGLSGRTTFQEVVDQSRARQVPDPFRDQILRILG